MSYQQRQHQQQRPRFQPPKLYSISKGTVSRIEQYGCFVKLHSSPVSGLVHISQLHANKIDDVNDVVSLNDEVWVKVMDVQVVTFEDEMSGKTQQRHKVKLSMKYVHQDTGQDLDPENEQLEGDMLKLMQRSRGGGGGGGGGNRGRGNLNDGGIGGANSQLGKALASNIGMSIAIDPGSLILKGKSGGGAMASTDFNGYALVGEEEGEPAEPMIDHNKKLVESSKPTLQPPMPVVRPMGRGRGSTLPAWMTRSDPDDRLGSMNGVPGQANESDNGKQDDTGRDDNRKRSSRKRDKGHRRDRHHSSSRKDRKKAKDRKKRSSSKDHRRRKGRSRSQSYSHDSSSESHADGSSYHSRSRSRSPEERRRRSSHSKKKSHRGSRKSSSKHHHRRGSRNRDDLSATSRSRSRSQEDESPRQSSTDFANEEEARAVMERLGRLRR